MDQDSVPQFGWNLNVNKIKNKNNNGLLPPVKGQCAASQQSPEGIRNTVTFH